MNSSLESIRPGDTAPAAGTEEDLRELLKRCPPATYKAACRYRQTGDPAWLPAILVGVIEHHVETDLRGKLREPDDALRLVEDLGLDSLTMMEILMVIEDVLGVSIGNEEVSGLRTLGDVRQLVVCRLCNLPAAIPARLPPGRWGLEGNPSRAT